MNVSPAWLAGGAMRLAWMRGVPFPSEALRFDIYNLWQTAAPDDEVLRKCPTCQGLFNVNTTNTRKAYCSFRCKNLAGVRRHRMKSA